MSIRVLFLLLCAMFLQTSVHAQLMTAAERIDMRKTADLGGKALVCIISPHDDLIIGHPSTEGDEIPKEVYKNKDGEFVYEFLSDPSANYGQRAYNISRQGSALRARIDKIIVKANECRYFYVAEAPNGIMLETLEAQTNDTHFEDREACVEITTELVGMKVDVFPKSFPATIKRGKNAAGVNVISVVIDWKGMEIYQQAEALSEDYDDVIKFMGKVADTSAAYVKLDTRLQEIEKQREEIALKISEAGGMPFIKISGENTNDLVIDIMDIGLTIKSKKCFAVLTLKETVFGREYNQYWEGAQQAERTRQYSMAKGLYEQALNETDITAEEKETCEKKVEQMATCIAYMSEANKALDSLQVFKKSGKEVEFSRIESFYKCVIDNYASLHEIMNDEIYLERIKKLETSLNNMDIVVSGRVVQTKKKQGVFTETPMTGVEIYAVGIEGQRDHVGSVDAQGNFKIQVKKSKYTELLFVPLKGKTARQSLSGKHLGVKVYIYD